MREITVFEDLDHGLHRSQELCLRQDAKIEKRQEIKKQVNAIMGVLSNEESETYRKDLRNGSWIQHDPQVVFEVAKKIKELVMQQCPDSVKRFSKLDDTHGFVGIANEMSFFFGRCYTAQTEETPLEQAGYPLGRIRADGREFNQPFYTNCKESDIEDNEGVCVYTMGHVA